MDTSLRAEVLNISFVVSLNIAKHHKPKYFWVIQLKLSNDGIESRRLMGSLKSSI